MQFYSIYHAATIRGVSRLKKKTKISCIHQEGIIHVTAYAELYKHEFSLGFMIHTPCTPLQAALLATNSFLEEKKSQTNEFVCASSENIRLWRGA